MLRNQSVPNQYEAEASGLAYRLRLLGTLVLLLLTVPGCKDSGKPDFQWDPPDFRVKGTYYFQPRAAINNFWWSFDLEQCKKDFIRLREDGFNTIILMIPWGGGSRPQSIQSPTTRGPSPI